MIQITLRFATAGSIPCDSPGFLAIAAETFPDGYSLFAGYGYWRNPETGDVDSEPSYALVATVDLPLAAAREKAQSLSAWIRGYYSQSAVFAEFAEVTGVLFGAEL